ncbi:unnamed protein product [Umbelopsis sp. WA50703]
MSIQILQLPDLPKLEPLDLMFEPKTPNRKRMRPSKETRAIVERELMLVRTNSKFTEHFDTVHMPRPISTSSYESSEQTSSQGSTSSRTSRRRRSSLALVQRLFTSGPCEPEPLEVSWLDADICDSKHKTSKKFPALKGFFTAKRLRQSRSFTYPDQYALSSYRTTSWWSESPALSIAN